MQYQREEYPRPQFRREHWQSLNGEWEFAFDDEKIGEKCGYATGRVALTKKIVVPFAYQTKASGLGDESSHEVVWYRRAFTIDTLTDNILLCFNGCDYQTSVWVNGVLATTHTGAYTAFKADITEYLRRGENVVVVKCYDPVSTLIPRGKQSFKDGGKPFACWYVPTTGIWQSVWLESFRTDCIDRYSLLSDVDNGTIYGEIDTLYGLADEAKISVRYNDQTVKEETFRFDTPRVRFSVDVRQNGELHLWDVERPNLYYVDFTLYKQGEPLDVCHSRLGMRKIETKGAEILLNGKPLYQRLVLDQGYWQDTDLTPPSADALKKDIELSKAMGFNGARKHQKIEDPYYCYYAEELGFLTWCEMPSAYEFSDDMAQTMLAEWASILSVAKNCTSNVCYVPLNEGWGVEELPKNKQMQAFAVAMYHTAKAIDPTRPVSTDDGFKNIDETDLVGVHDYAYDDAKFDESYIRGDWSALTPCGYPLFAEGTSYRGQPILLTEFGGVAMQSDSKGENWGYGEGATNAEAFYRRIETLLNGIARSPFCGYCYTQLTDLQQEVNGLLDYAHKPKFDIDRLRSIFTFGKEEA